MGNGRDERCSAANTATWLARLGTRVLFAGRVGADPLGRALVAGLEQEGVEARVVEDAGAPTGVVLALTSPGGERSMLISPAAAARLAAWTAAWVVARPGAVPPGWTGRHRESAWEYATGGSG